MRKAVKGKSRVTSSFVFYSEGDILSPIPKNEVRGGRPRLFLIPERSLRRHSLMPSRRPPRGNYWKQCTTALAPNRQHCFLIYREEVHTVHTATPSQGGKRGTFLIPLAVNALLAILAGLLLGYCTLCRTVIIDSRESESVRE